MPALRSGGHTPDRSCTASAVRVSNPVCSFPVCPKSSGRAGVGGWLLFYCIVLDHAGAFGDAGPDRDATRVFRNPYFLIDGARVLYGLGGRRGPLDGPASRFLFLLRIYFITVAATVLLGRPEIVCSLRCGPIIRYSWRLVLSPVMELAGLHDVLWFAYFRKSIRVRNTYGANLVRRSAVFDCLDQDGA